LYTKIVLCYHSVNYKPKYRIGIEPVSHSNFLDHINFLNSNFKISNLNSIFDVSKENEVYLTFDDGYKDNLTTVANLLNKMNTPASFFISPFYVENNYFFYTDIIPLLIQLDLYYKFISRFNLKFQMTLKMDTNSRRAIQSVSLLNNSEIELIVRELNAFVKSNNLENFLPSVLNKCEVKSLSDNLKFSIGNHTYYHSRYSPYRENEFRNDIQLAIPWFQKNSIHLNGFFPYPFGDFGSISTIFSNRLKQEFALNTFSTIPLTVNLNKSPSIIPRISVQNWSLETFKHIIQLVQILSRSRNIYSSALRIRFLLNQFRDSV
jgi:peptidoglycan/xylan/chitin deacetylase (PgdA/CDA1 family)